MSNRTKRRAKQRKFARIAIQNLHPRPGLQAVTAQRRNNNPQVTDLAGLNNTLVARSNQCAELREQLAWLPGQVPALVDQELAAARAAKSGLLQATFELEVSSRFSWPWLLPGNPVEQVGRTIGISQNDADWHRGYKYGFQGFPHPGRHGLAYESGAAVGEGADLLQSVALVTKKGGERS